MGLESFLKKISQVKLNVDGQEVIGKISTGDHKPAVRCDAEVGGVPTAGFGESPQEAVQNIEKFLNTH